MQTRPIKPQYIKSLLDESVYNAKEDRNPLLTMSFINFFLGDYESLSKSVCQLISCRPEFLNHVTYSLLPSIFRLFMSDSLLKQYVDFLEELYGRESEMSLTFAKSIFLIPEVRTFLTLVENSLPFQLYDIRSTLDAEKYLNSILSSFQNHLLLLPSIFQILNQCEHAKQFFGISFFKAAFEIPILYGLAQISDNVVEGITSILAETIERICFIDSFSDIISSSKKSIKIEVYEKVSKLIPAYGHTFYFEQLDLQLLYVMASLSKIHDTCTPDPVPNEFSLIVVHDSPPLIVNNEQKDLELKEQTESILRNILIISDDLQPITDNNIEILSYVKDNIIPMASSPSAIQQRIQYSIFQNRFQKYGNNLFDTFDKSKMNSQTNNALAERLNVFTETKSIILKQKVYHVSLIHDMTLDLQYEILGAFLAEIKLSLPGESYLYRQVLKSTAESWISSWIKFSREKDFSLHLINDIFVLHILRLYTYEKMCLSIPDFTINDENIFQVCENTIKDLYTDGEPQLQQLLTTNANRFDSSIDTIRTAFSMSSTIMTVKLIGLTLQKIENVLNEAENGFDEIGEDQRTPCVLFVILKAKPKHFFSKVEYLQRALYTFYDMLETEEIKDYVNNVVILEHAAAFLSETASKSIKVNRYNFFDDDGGNDIM